MKKRFHGILLGRSVWAGLVGERDRTRGVFAAVLEEVSEEVEGGEKRLFFEEGERGIRGGKDGGGQLRSDERGRVIE